MTCLGRLGSSTGSPRPLHHGTFTPGPMPGHMGGTVPRSGEEEELCVAKYTIDNLHGEAVQCGLIGM